MERALPLQKPFFESLRYRFVHRFYAQHTVCRSVQKALAKCLDELPAGGVGLNVGAGATNVDPRVKNLDIEAGPNIDYVASAEAIPLESASVDLVITQETLEHVPDPFLAMREISRVLKSGGTLFCQVPFVIGYHPRPQDFWRFTKEGIVRLAEGVGMKCVELTPTEGPGVGFYFVLVEFFAMTLSLPLPSIYKLTKALGAVLFYPVRLMDGLLVHSPQRDRICGGYYIIAKKT